MKINILGYTYKIVFTPDVKALVGEKCRTGFDGYFDSDKGCIYIDNKIPKDAQISTLLHEIIEVIVSKLNIKITHDDLERLEVGLFQTLSTQNIFKGTNFVYNVCEEIRT